MGDVKYIPRTPFVIPDNVFSDNSESEMDPSSDSDFVAHIPQQQVSKYSLRARKAQDKDRQRVVDEHKYLHPCTAACSLTCQWYQCSSDKCLKWICIHHLHSEYEYPFCDQSMTDSFP